MVFAGLSHLFWARREFQAQVPDWTGKVIDKDGVVVASGVVEIMLGAALVALPRERSRVGAILAAFFVAIFPGNIEQYTKGKNGFGMTDDRIRLVRLFFQPALFASHCGARASRRTERRPRAPTGVGAGWEDSGMLLHELVATTDAVAATSSRLAKIDALARPAGPARVRRDRACDRLSDRQTAAGADRSRMARPRRARRRSRRPSPR